jgi:TolA-binding protein
MLKASCLLLGVAAFSAAIGAESADPCAGSEGPALAQCRGNQQTLRQQERLEQLLQQQQERQNQLDQQQRDVQQQLESLRLQNETLRKQLEREMANQPTRPSASGAVDSSKGRDVQAWRSDNPWFGSDYARTQFAMRYIKQLQQERPDLYGRPLLDALSTKVDETFGAKR